MKASSSISASSTDKAFGLSSSASAAGQGTGDTGFLAMLDGIIQSAGTGSGPALTPDQGKNGQGAADLGDDESLDADGTTDIDAAGDAKDNVILAGTDVASAQTSLLPAVTGTAPVSGKPDAIQPVIAKTTTPVSAPVSDDALAALAVQAGLVTSPAAPAQTAQPVQASATPAKAVQLAQSPAASLQTAAQPANTDSVVSSPASLVAAPAIAVATQPVAAAAASASAVSQLVSDQAADGSALTAATPDASSHIKIDVAGTADAPKAQTQSESDEGNSDTQQSVILSALFAQAPLQILPQQTASSALSAKPVSGNGALANAGVSSVPGVGISPTLSPPVDSGNGSIFVNAHALAASSSDKNQDVLQQVALSPVAFGIGASAPDASAGDATTFNAIANDDAASQAQTPAIANDQIKAEAIASLFAAPLVKAAKTDGPLVKDDSSIGAAPTTSDVGATGLTLVHASGATGFASAASGSAAVTQPYISSPAEQVSLTLARAVNNGPQSMTIALDPIELGKVEVKLAFAKDGSVQASVTADRPETLTMLKNDHSTLTQALHNAGLTTTSGSLSFNLRDGGNSQQQQGFGNASSFRPGSTQIDAEDTVSTTTVQYAVANSDGRLDVRV